MGDNSSMVKSLPSLLLAAEIGNVDAVAAQLAAGADVNERGYRNDTPLILASEKGHCSIVEMLLKDTNVDINLRNNYDDSPISLASKNGHDSAVSMLLKDTKVNFNVRNHNGNTPIALAAENGQNIVVGQLVAHSANPNLQNTSGATPLWLAAKHGHTAVVRELLANDRTDVYSQAVDGKGCPVTPLELALIYDFREIVELLAHTDSINHCVSPYTFIEIALYRGFEDLALDSLDIYYSGKCSADDNAKAAALPVSELLVLAASGGCLKATRKLLENNSTDVNAIFSFNRGDIMYFSQRSSLMEASKRGNTSAVQLLLQTEGIQTNLAGGNSITALILAAREGLVDVVKILLENGADATAKDNDGRTALSYAAQGGHEAVVIELLAREAADPDSQDSTARTPIMWAMYPEGGDGREDCEKGDRRGGYHDDIGDGCDKITIDWQAQENIVRRLLANGRVSPNNRDQYGWTPLSYAAKTGKLELVTAILEHRKTDPNCGDSKPLAVAAHFKHTDIVRGLLNTGRVDVNAVCTIERQTEPALTGTALMFAAGSGGDSVVDLLLTIPGIMVNGKGKQGITPLMMAVWNGGRGVLWELLGVKGVDLNAQDQYGRTALCHSALSYGHTLDYNGKKSLSEMLVDAGINTDLPDNEGRTTLSHAAEANHLDLVNLLLRIKSTKPDAKDRARRSPLSWAITDSHAIYDSITGSKKRRTIGKYEYPKERGEAVQRLLCDPAVDPNAMDNDGKTPLLRAIETAIFSEKYVQLLLAHPRIDVDKPGGDGITPLAFAEELKKASVYRMLKGHRKTVISVKNQLEWNRLPLSDQQEFIGEWTTGRNEELCSVCAKIDLDDFLSSEFIQTAHYMLDTCPLCRLLTAIIASPFFCSSQSLLHSYLRPTLEEVGNDLLDSWVDTTVISDISLHLGFITHLGAACPYGLNSVTIPRLSVDNSDSRMCTAKDWISHCRHNHSERCNPLNKTAVKHLYLIDCKTKVVTEWNGSENRDLPPFTALSYVWGEQSKQQLRLNERLKSQYRGEEPIDDSEAVVKDAISVTLGLGYQYLWIDRFCIDQNGQNENRRIKHEQMQNMHAIYANAEVTLVAAAGSDASAGLPGAPGHSREYQQPGALIKGHALVAVPPDPTFHIGRTTWATRGWTFQEGLLARRRLFFSKYEMSYECRDMLCREAVRLPPKIEQQMSKDNVRLMEDSWMYSPHRLTGISDYDDGSGLFDLLHNYCKRNLSEQSDTLNAMLGVFQLLAEQERPIYHVCGVPILRKYDNINRKDGNRKAAGSARLALQGFLAALSWTLTKPATRRPGFPSWSWTGWDGVIEGNVNRLSRTPDCEKYAVLDVNVAIVHLGHADNVVPWDRFYGLLESADPNSKDLLSAQYHVLEITASEVTVQIYSVTVGFDTRETRCQVCIGNCVWLGIAFWTWNGEDADGINHYGDVAALSRAKDFWTGVVLGEFDDKTHVLIVQEQQPKQQSRPAASAHTYWERVGLLQLDTPPYHRLQDEAPERRTWLLA